MRALRPTAGPTLALLSLLTQLTLPPLASPALAQLPLPAERTERVDLPELALPVAGETPGRLVSLAELRGERYILHVFASW